MAAPSGSRHSAAARHPSQLYEAALEGLVLFLILRVAITRFRLLRFRGACTGLFLGGYGSARFFVEFFREPDSYAATLGFLTRGMLLSLPMVAPGNWKITQLLPKTLERTFYFDTKVSVRAIYFSVSR